MTNAFTDGDMLLLRDQLLAEIGRRLKDPAERKRLTSSQLVTAARDLAKLTAGNTPEADDTDLDLFGLVERLPAAQRKKHLQAERVRLQDRLVRVNEALG